MVATTNLRHGLALATAMVLGAASLAGCSRQDQAQAEAKTSELMTRAGEQAEDVKAKAATGIDQARDATRDMAHDAQVAGREAGRKLEAKLGDAAITASVKAELAKSPDVNPLKINVDTDGGRVSLRGIVGSEAARGEAARIAAAVSGVAGVDNQLAVRSEKQAAN